MNNRFNSVSRHRCRCLHLLLPISGHFMEAWTALAAAWGRYGRTETPIRACVLMSTRCLGAAARELNLKNAIVHFTAGIHSFSCYYYICVGGL